MSINKVLLTGNLTRDPELKSLPNGTSVLDFGIAVNDRKRNPQTEQWEDVPNFFDCTVFGNRAESLARYLAKGMKVAIEGRLHWHQWQDRDTGQNRSKVDVTVNEIEFITPRREDGQQPTQTAPQQYAQPVQAPQTASYAAQQPVQQPVYPQVQPQQPVQYAQPVQAVGDAYSDADIPF